MLTARRASSFIRRFAGSGIVCFRFHQLVPAGGCPYESVRTDGRTCRTDNQPDRPLWRTMFQRTAIPVRVLGTGTGVWRWRVRLLRSRKAKLFKLHDSAGLAMMAVLHEGKQLGTSTGVCNRTSQSRTAAAE